MSRRLFSIVCISLSIQLSSQVALVAQDAQAGAAAKAAREQVKADAGRSALDIATPTDVGAPAHNDLTPSSQTEQLKRRAGEQVGPDAEGRTLILGMKVQEADHGGVKVVDVGAATPAYEAGIRKGDQIVSFQDFKANDYRKWIDGMRRVATGAKDGAMLTVVVLRDGNPVTTKVRVPESHVGPVQLPLGPPPGQPQAAGSPVQPVAGGDGGSVTNTNVAIENSGPFANFFSGQNGAPAERAMAELFRVGGDKLAAHTGNSEKAVRPNRHGARIGLAGFRNDPNGMLVMVDVGGLEPGNYNVGIGDPSVSIGQPVSDVGNSDGSNPALPAPNPGENAPFQPQGSNQPADIPKSVLAEVAPNTAGVTAPATGQVNPITAPATGAVNPTNTTATGQSTVTNQEPQQQLNEQNGRPAGPPGINDIGTLTVDQSGTGRMQHVVEGIRVQNVVGQALIISSFATPRAKTLPPNLDATADPASRKPAERADVSAPSTANGTIPAAAGIIRLISDRGPGPGAGEQQGVPAGRNAPASQRTPAPVGLQQ